MKDSHANQTRDLDHGDNDEQQKQGEGGEVGLEVAVGQVEKVVLKSNGLAIDRVAFMFGAHPGAPLSGRQPGTAVVTKTESCRKV
jgi:hypothetical protein